MKSMVSRTLDRKWIKLHKEVDSKYISQQEKDLGHNIIELLYNTSGSKVAEHTYIAKHSGLFIIEVEPTWSSADYESYTTISLHNGYVSLFHSFGPLNRRAPTTVLHVMLKYS